MKCPCCGSPCGQRDAYCAVCGAKLNFPEISTPSVNTQGTQPSGGTMPENTAGRVPAQPVPPMPPAPPVTSAQQAPSVPPVPAQRPFAQEPASARPAPPVTSAQPAPSVPPAPAQTPSAPEPKQQEPSGQQIPPAQQFVFHPAETPQPGPQTGGLPAGTPDAGSGAPGQPFFPPEQPAAPYPPEPEGYGHPEAPPQPPRHHGYQGTPGGETGSGDLGGRLLQVFAAVCAVAYAVRFLANFFPGVFYALGSLLEVEPLFAITNLLRAVTGVLYLGAAILLLMMVLRRTRENSDSLFVGLCSCSIGAVAICIVRCVIAMLQMLLRWGGSVRFVQNYLPTILCNLVVVAGVYGILYLFGEAPLAGKSGAEIQSAASELPLMVTTFLQEMLGAFNRARPATGQAAQNTAYTQPNGYSQQPGYNQQPGYGQQAPGYNYAPVGPMVKSDRSLLLYILLSGITCGIYALFFFHKWAQDVNTVCEGDGQRTAGLLKMILLSLVTCGIYNVIWYYQLGNRLAINAPRYGMSFQENGTTVLLWFLFGWLLCGIGPFVAMHILFKNTNILCAAYNSRMYGN